MKKPMLDRAGLFLISVALVLASLAVAVWLVASGQARYLDGIFLLLSSLAVAFAFSVYIGLLIKRAREELQEKPAAKKTVAAAAKPPAEEVAAQPQP